jgi:hypothetical protein
MSPIAIRSLELLSVSVAAMLLTSVACVARSSHLIDAIEAVGADTQLPLERIASGGTFADVDAHVARRATHAAACSAVHFTAPEREHCADYARGRADRTPGYRRTIDDPKDWT